MRLEIATSMWTDAPHLMTGKRDEPLRVNATQLLISLITTHYPGKRYVTQCKEASRACDTCRVKRYVSTILPSTQQKMSNW